MLALNRIPSYLSRGKRLRCDDSCAPFRYGIVVYSITSRRKLCSGGAVGVTFGIAASAVDQPDGFESLRRHLRAS
jgi:hypothetical protein